MEPTAAETPGVGIWGSVWRGMARYGRAWRGMEPTAVETPSVGICGLAGFGRVW